jgi:hypothetical protein
MKLSAVFTLWMSVAFTLVCGGYGVYGVMQIASMPQGAERDDAIGFACFWLFLGVIGLTMGIVSWRMTKMEERG